MTLRDEEKVEQLEKRVAVLEEQLHRLNSLYNIWWPRMQSLEVAIATGDDVDEFTST